MMRFVYLFISLFTVGQIFAQDANAKKLLDQVSKKYDSYKTVQSNFTFKATQANGESYSDQGELFLNKPQQKYKIALPEQDLISDGKSVWSVLKEDKEVQVSEADHSGQAIGPNNIFTFYRTGYTFKTSASESDAAAGKLTAIELAPQNKTSNYAKIKVRINKNNHIQDVTIFDKSGAKYMYSINTLFVNHQIADTNFQFQKDKYPGFELVDLR